MIETEEDMLVTYVDASSKKRYYMDWDHLQWVELTDAKLKSLQGAVAAAASAAAAAAPSASVAQSGKGKGGGGGGGTTASTSTSDGKRIQVPAEGWVKVTDTVSSQQQQQQQMQSQQQAAIDDYEARNSRQVNKRNRILGKKTNNIFIFVYC